jgi:activator of HSP90 ATPase
MPQTEVPELRYARAGWNLEEAMDIERAVCVRRQLLVGTATMLGALALTTGAASAAAVILDSSDATKTFLHQEALFGASPARIYEIFLNSKEFAAMTKLPADISPDAGGAFSMFGGVIVGRNIELIPAQRIMQAWRPKYWNPGVYSMVKFELETIGIGTKIILDHTGFPPGTYKGLNSGWPERYWDPLRKYLG